jgi:hypothetical protein
MKDPCNPIGFDSLPPARIRRAPSIMPDADAVADSLYRYEQSGQNFSHEEDVLYGYSVTGIPARFEYLA